MRASWPAVSPYPDLISIVVVPDRVRFVSQRRRTSQQLVVGGRAGGCDGRADSTGLVGTAGHAGRELLGTVTGEHQVAVTVDESGHHTTTSGVDSLIGDRRLTRTDCFDEPVDQHDPCITQLAGCADLELGVVGDQQTDVVDHRRRAAHDQTFVIERLKSAATSIVR